MSDALRIAHGAFGRVALLDIDAPLVRHAHPHCHVLIKAEGADTQFVVRDCLVPLTRNDAVLINAWEPHHYAHDPARPRTIVLAPHIEPDWLVQFRPNWTASGAPGFFQQPGVTLPARVRRLANEMAEALAGGAETQLGQEALLSALMIAVIEPFTGWQQVGPSLRDLARATRTDHRIRCVAAIMRHDPAGVSDIGALARQTGLSRSQFFRLFEQATRVPPASSSTSCGSRARSATSSPAPPASPPSANAWASARQLTLPASSGIAPARPPARSCRSPAPPENEPRG